MSVKISSHDDGVVCLTISHSCSELAGILKMVSQSKDIVIERPNTNWRETSPDVVKEAAESATIAVLKKAACFALIIFKTTHGQVWIR